MSPWMTVMVAAAIAGLAARSVVACARQRRIRPLLASIAVLAGMAALLQRFFDFPAAHPRSASKNLASTELPVIGLLFAWSPSRTGSSGKSTSTTARRSLPRNTAATESRGRARHPPNWPESSPRRPRNVLALRPTARTKSIELRPAKERSRAMQRLVDHYLAIWREDSSRTSLLIRGARQVGKTFPFAL